jgi:ribonuclease III
MVSGMNSIEGFINEHFGTDDLLVKALTHSSFDGENNERMEFLGNAIINLCLADLLYYDHSEIDEDGLSKACNHLRSDPILAAVGRDLGLERMFRHGASIQSKDGVTDSMVAGAFEAIMEAIFNAGGYDKAKCFVKEFVLTDARVAEAIAYRSPTTELKELYDGMDPPLKPLFFSKNVDGDLLHYCHITIGQRTTMGVGKNKKEALSKASSCMLALMR